jgi:hypothetical protein
MDKSTIELLTEYNIDPQNTAIKQYYDADNLWKTLHIERDENKHSAFLAWLFEHDVNSENSPLIKLLNLLVLRSTEEQMDSRLKMAILKSKLRVKTAIITTEMIVSRLSMLNSNDRLDIYSKCDVDGVEGFSQLEIIIENKVGASERDAKNKNGVEWGKGLSQTQRYYHACHENRKDDSTVQLFVFLTGKEQKPQDGHFITISYQDLVDYILEPYLKNSNIDNHTEMAIKEYLRILGNPYYKTILATTMEEKELLKDFYDRNKDLFMRAIDVMIATTTDEDEKADLEDLQRTIKKTSRRHYTINGEGDYSMYQVVEKFVEFRQESGRSINEINQEIQIFVSSKWDFISNKQNAVAHSEKGEYISSNGLYITKQWKGKREEENFPRFMNGVNKNYSDFQIVEK